LKPLSPRVWQLAALAMGVVGFGLAATAAAMAQG
jgi:hypothetical protein